MGGGDTLPQKLYHQFLGLYYERLKKRSMAVQSLMQLLWRNVGLAPPIRNSFQANGRFTRGERRYPLNEESAWSPLSSDGLQCGIEEGASR